MILRAGLSIVNPISLLWLLSFASCNGLATRVPTLTRAELTTNIQRSFTPSILLENVGAHVDQSNDPDGAVSSLILVRLSKQLVTLDNVGNVDFSNADLSTLDAVVQHFTNIDISGNVDSNINYIDSIVEGTKACGVIYRILSPRPQHIANHINNMWDIISTKQFKFLSRLQPHHLSGLQWAHDCLQLKLPTNIQNQFDSLNLPFRIHVDFMMKDLSTDKIQQEAIFRIDKVKTVAGKLPERRQTCWQGNDGVAPFAYSGKTMSRDDWSPTVKTIRDELYKRQKQYYDCCLLNLYPDGDSGMRYHSDPDQGQLWGYDTTVVSIGASRRFAFRQINDEGNVEKDRQPHNFVVMHGDVCHMFGNCQAEYQHCVKKALTKDDNAPRVSLVYKQSKVADADAI